MKVIDLIEELMGCHPNDEIVVMTGPIELPKKNDVKAVLHHVEPGRVLIWVGER